MAIKDNIYYYRKKRGLTLEQLGTCIGVSKATVHRYETGAIENIPSDKIEGIAKACGVSPAAIMGWEEKETIKDTDSELKVALFGGDGEVTDEMWQEVKNFAQYIKNQRKNGLDENK